VAANKMDLVGFDRGVFDRICADFGELLEGAYAQRIPLSALHGDNIVTRSDRTPWYGGPSLLEHLESVDVYDRSSQKSFRLPVQLSSGRAVISVATPQICRRSRSCIDRSVGVATKSPPARRTSWTGSRNDFCDERS